MRRILLSFLYLGLTLGSLATLSAQQAPKGGESKKTPRDPLEDLLEKHFAELAERDDVPKIANWPERRKKLLAIRLQWVRQTTVEVFDKNVAPKTPWAGKGREALEALAKEGAQFALNGDQIDHSLRAKCHRLVKAALDAGADDPLIRYWGRKLDNWSGQQKWYENLAEGEEIVRALDASRYPDIRKLYAVYNLVVELTNSPPTEPRRSSLPKWEARFWELFERLAASEDPIVRENVMTIADRWAGLAAKKSSRLEAWEAILQHLRKGKSPRYEQLYAEAIVAIDRGAKARGSGLADSVTPEGWKVFFEENEKAKKLLEQAAALNPDDWAAPTMMVHLCRGLQLDYENTVKWFDLAMKANPDNCVACEKMLKYLHPKWGGNEKQYFGFMWRCIQTKNFGARIPLVVITEQYKEAPLVGFADTAQRAYYAQPTVWYLIRNALEGQLSVAPDDRFLRTELARFACVCKKYDIANTQFQILGENYWRAFFKSEDEYRKYRDEARAKSKNP